MFADDGSGAFDSATVAIVDSKLKKSYASGLFSTGILECDYTF